MPYAANEMGQDSDGYNPELANKEFQNMAKGTDYTDHIKFENELKSVLGINDTREGKDYELSENIQHSNNDNADHIEFENELRSILGIERDVGGQAKSSQLLENKNPVNQIEHSNNNIPSNEKQFLLSNNYIPSNANEIQHSNNNIPSNNVQTQHLNINIPSNDNNQNSFMKLKDQNKEANLLGIAGIGQIIKNDVNSVFMEQPLQPLNTNTNQNRIPDLNYNIPNKKDALYSSINYNVQGQNNKNEEINAIINNNMQNLDTAGSPSYEYQDSGTKLKSMKNEQILIDNVEYPGKGGFL